MQGNIYDHYKVYVKLKVLSEENVEVSIETLEGVYTAKSLGSKTQSCNIIPNNYAIHNT